MSCPPHPPTFAGNMWVGLLLLPPHNAASCWFVGLPHCLECCSGFLLVALVSFRTLSHSCGLALSSAKVRLADEPVSKVTKASQIGGPVGVSLPCTVGVHGEAIRLRLVSGTCILLVPVSRNV